MLGTQAKAPDWGHGRTRGTLSVAGGMPFGADVEGH